MKFWVLSVQVFGDEGTGVLALFKQADKRLALERLKGLYKDEAQDDNLDDVDAAFAEDLHEFSNGTVEVKYGDICTWTLELMDVED